MLSGRVELVFCIVFCIDSSVTFRIWNISVINIYLNLRQLVCVFLIYFHATTSFWALRVLSPSNWLIGPDSIDSHCTYHAVQKSWKDRSGGSKGKVPGNNCLPKSTGILTSPSIFSGHKLYTSIGMSLWAMCFCLIYRMYFKDTVYTENRVYKLCVQTVCVHTHGTAAHALLLHHVSVSRYGGVLLERVIWNLKCHNFIKKLV